MNKLNPLQQKLLEMLSWFHTFCVEHNLTYYLSSGTMLGAARHQGFIPWDDDIDVMMPREDIDKLEKLMANRQERYIIETPNTDANDFFYSFPKIYDTTTTLVENTKRKIKRGIYIDIFPIDGIGDTEETATTHLKKIRKAFNLLLCKTTGFRAGRAFYKNLIVALFRFIPLNEKKLLKKLIALCKTYSWTECKLCGNPVGAYGMKEIMPRNIYGTPTLYKFEDFVFFGVELYEEYLTRLYGNWRQLPPAEKRSSHHDYLFLNLEKGYCEDNKK